MCHTLGCLGRHFSQHEEGEGKLGLLNTTRPRDSLVGERGGEAGTV